MTTRKQNSTTDHRPQPIAEILADLMARRGYAREQTGAACAAAWRQAVGEFMAAHTRCGGVRRGALQVAVANSTLVQEITFRKQDLIRQLSQLLPDERIVDLRLRVGPIH